MSKAPKDPQEIFPDIINGLKDLFADELLSIILYGSAASGDYVPGKSDINFMIALSDAGIDRIDLAFDLVAGWQKRNVATPLFLTEAYVRTSLDVFPIEYLNFQNNYKLVYGKDILQDLSFDSEFLRLQCEREIKGKMLLLREGFLESRGKGRNLQPLIAGSLGALIAIFNGLLHLRGRELPHRHRDVIVAFCEVFEIDTALFVNLLDVKEKKVKLSDSELTGLFEDYLREVKKLWQMVDTLHTEKESVRT
jgi:predicted nucleotidyltransferase